MSPVLPQTLKDLIPTSTDTLCAAFIKTIKFQIQLYKWYSYAYDGEGNLNTGFAADLCNVRENCPS